jgi:hypothetical protein
MAVFSARMKGTLDVDAPAFLDEVSEVHAALDDDERALVIRAT